MIPDQDSIQQEFTTSVNVPVHESCCNSSSLAFSCDACVLTMQNLLTTGSMALKDASKGCM